MSESAHSLTSEAKGSIICPKCGKVGQLKHRQTYYKGQKSTRYAQVDHWNDGNNHASGYSHSCYLGKLTQDETKKRIN